MCWIWIAVSLNKDIKKREDKLLALSFYICVLAVVWILLQIVSFTSFRIPTDSMQPALHPGDNILVNKSIMGARIFNIWEAAENPFYGNDTAGGGTGVGGDKGSSKRKMISSLVYRIRIDILRKISERKISEYGKPFQIRHIGG